MMLERTLEEVLEEFASERHEPMVRFVTALRQRPWAQRLRFDVSMLRLWLAPPHASRVQAMVTYGDGRGGGRPLNAELDKYDLTLFRDTEDAVTTSQPLVETLDHIGILVANYFASP